MTTTTATIDTRTLSDDNAVTGANHAEPGDYYPDFRGVNYDPHADTKDIAATIRRELNRATKDGKLDPVVSVSVKMSRFAGGSAIDVTLHIPAAQWFVDANTPDAVQCEDWSGLQWFRPDAIGQPSGRYQREAYEALGRVTNFVRTFKHDKSDMMTDYFCVNFYDHVNVLPLYSEVGR